ncbi:tautomerase family protein [Segniliparus rugosus]|uniref:4-oxalocrotonate tautomerase family enzyme n=1 Tax=Segniliparus rugosus (strain ATCC BAA-974 / DSM 45345 / CCUG 50838 / CIP 108380 / JCM 13579 / CDC 945) TaxID=679197 RepID=E5XRG8_SEGRC|nr:4-oxalocrotonate tautomerase family protein [Segniliparus rugosus]EFV13070.1 4-oxalocrotonate tautomerase family enzyme [Segniliparus rugosus ATCC BAA-974]
MPLLDVSLKAGRSPEQLRELIAELTATVQRVLGAPPEAVSVILREVAPTHWANANTTLAERDAQS